jgi:P-type E1-E2 ATPase
VETSVVGRISPQGKKRFVEALARSGRYVAMVGDGVNDVLALKAARLAIAQGTGAQIAKSVADIVLVRGEFSAVPSMVGRAERSSGTCSGSRSSSSPSRPSQRF